MAEDRQISSRRSIVSLRSVIIGLLGVIVICGITPYNDFAVNNTYLVGNFLPVGLVLFLVMAALLINAPLYKWLPKYALRQGELAVITAMILSACSLPGSGLMRYLPTGIVGAYTTASIKTDVAQMLEKTGLPAWLRPDVGTESPAEIGNTEVFRNYLARSPDGTVPWSAWAWPMAIWGIFFACMWGLTIFLSLIVNTQWAENEKLAFPLATVYTSLIESPEPGRCLNTLFRSYGFWIAAASVFVFHGFNGLHAYFPSFPEIPRSFDFSTILTESPWRFMLIEFKRSEVYFSIIGITFFLQTRTSFSIWFYVVMLQIVLMIMGTQQYDFSEAAKKDETFGGLVTLSLVLIYAGRKHWWMVIRSMFGRDITGQYPAHFISHAQSGWGVVICFIGLNLFLMSMGSTFIGAICTSLALVMLVMTIARVVAETGLIFVQVNWSPSRLWAYPIHIPTHPISTTSASFLATSWTGYILHDLRESFASFFQQGLRVVDLTESDQPRANRSGWKIILAVVLALVVGYVVSAAGMLWTEYHYAATLTTAAEAPLNKYGIDQAVREQILEPLQGYPNIPKESHNQIFHIFLGSGIVGSLSILRMTYSWWPLHPIGFIILYSWATRMIWFSVLLGWLAKVVIVRTGGISLFRTSRNFFIGLVIGEATAAGFWLIVSLVLNFMGYEYHRILLLPY